MTFLQKELLPVLVIILVFLQGCGSSGAINQGQTEVYNQSFDKMIGVLKKAIDESRLGIQYLNETKGGNKINIGIYSRRVNHETSNSEERDPGSIVIEKIGKSKTRISIINPEYHFSVPMHQRSDYRKILKNKIDKLLSSS